MKSYFVILLLATAFIFQISMASAQMHEVNYSINAGATSNAQFAVQVLKYEPYPVNPGEWFDLWVKVQNVGQEDARNARFELIPEYPFSSNDSLVRNYGLVPGVANAYKISQAIDEIDANQVILKYRVKVADNAPIGESAIKLETATDINSQNGLINALPIEIAETKTNFDVVPQDSTTQGISFAIANTGDNDATAVIVSIAPQNSSRFTSSSIIGNLAKGDFTTVTFQTSSSTSSGQSQQSQTSSNFRNSSSSSRELRIQIAYTDIAGVRNTIEKTMTMPVSRTTTTAQTTTTSSSSKILYIIIGAILGIIAVFIYRMIKRNK